MTSRRAVLEAFLKVTEEGAFANLAAKDAFSDVCANDVGRSTALLYTALEHMAYCDHIIAAYARGRLRPAIRGILRLAVAELFFMDTPDHAVCNESVKLTAEIGKAQLKGYVNGVIRSIIRDRDADKLPPLPADPAERLVIETGYPRFIVEEDIKRFGVTAAEDLLKAGPCKSCIRAVYPSKLDTLLPELERFGPSQDELLPDDAAYVDNLEGIAGSEAFSCGSITVQSPGAMLACRCIGPQPGMRVLDCCAAPGGKTAYIFDLMQRRGSMLAWELHPHRAELIENTLRRLKIPFKRLSDEEYQANALDLLQDGVAIAAHDASERVPVLEGFFDAVLCDVPCSGLGGGTKPDARMRRTFEGVRELAGIQSSILSACSKYVKPGGVLVYSTCTVSLAENEGVVGDFLDKNSDFYADDINAFLPLPLKGRGGELGVTLLPNVDGIEGFFISRLIRRK